MASGWQPPELASAYQQALESLPYFQISGGRNHIFVFVTVDGPDVFSEWCAWLVNQRNLWFEYSRDYCLCFSFALAITPAECDT
jgi:hypothetical protein